MFGQMDGNQADLTRDLNLLGWTTIDTHNVGPNAIGGFPDLIAYDRDFNVLFIEIKMPGGGLTKAEKRFHQKYEGLVHIVENTDQILELIGSTSWTE